MKEAFLVTLDPILTLFICIAIGYILRKLGILPDGSGKAMATLETWVFCPALTFITMARYCTPSSLAAHAINVSFSAIGVLVAIAMAIPLGRLFVKSPSPERGVYYYALTFANSGYFGDPVVANLFGEEMLSYYKMFCLPITVVIYTWGLSILTPTGKGGGLKKLLNPPMVAMVLGIIAGLLGVGTSLPTFILGSLDSLKSCMGPVAMLLAGYTIAGYSVKSMLKKKKVYIASVLRLVVFPSVIIAVLFGLKSLVGLIPGVAIDNSVIYLALVATAAPLGLNTVVFPEAYGGDPETGAAMAMISHTLAVVSLPLMLALTSIIFGPI